MATRADARLQAGQQPRGVAQAVAPAGNPADLAERPTHHVEASAFAPVPKTPRSLRTFGAQLHIVRLVSPDLIF